MIDGTHVILYSRDAEADRAFLRDVLGLKHVDVGGGWLVFQLPPAELGVHPTGAADDAPGTELYFMCDDLEATLADLAGRGAGVPAEREEASWGVRAAIVLPS